MVPDQARRLWRTLAADEAALQPGTSTVVRGSRGICPSGWTGVICLGDAALVEAGDADEASMEDIDESSVSEMDQVIVLRRGRQLLGPACHLEWPAGVGHLGVPVAPDARGAGVGSALGAAATQRVLDRGLAPQWRAARSNEASRRLARRIGYREMGRQFSFRLA